MMLTMLLRTARSTFERISQRKPRRRTPRPLVAAEFLEQRTLLSAGTLDPTFGTGGLVSTPIADAEKVAGNDVAIQSDGKIVVVGHRQVDANNANNFIVVARYNQDGSLDSTFGSGGLLPSDPNLNGKARGVAIDDQHRIVIVSEIGHSGRVIRLTSDGSFDPSFSDDGHTVLGPMKLLDVKLQQDGKIVAVGEHWLAGTNGPGDLGDFVVTRFNVDGSLDTTFDGDGIASIDFSSTQAVADEAGRRDFAEGVDIDSSGRIVVTGWTYDTLAGNPQINHDIALARYNSDGTLDATFGTGGKLRLDVSGSYDDSKAIAVDDDGKLLIAARATRGSIIRLNDDGTFDTTFGGGDGIFSPAWSVATLRDIVVQADGKIVAAGGHNNSVVSVIRLHPDGSWDNSFGVNGEAAVNPSSDSDVANGVALQDDGKIVVAGFNHNDDVAPPIIGVARFNGDVEPSEVVGIVWEDTNNDGQVNFGEKAIEGVTLTLTGTDDLGNAMNLSTQTDVDGIYMFIDLRPSDENGYTITETQPLGFDDGLDSLGTVDGSSTGTNPSDDVFSDIVLTSGSVAENYNFGERPEAGGEVSAGQTATIGFWQNNNGQALIESLNGGATSTQLGDWLAATFPNMYGPSAGTNDLTGKTNGEVADFYSDLFRRKKKEAVQLGLGGPVKTDAQVLATALAVYVTNSTLSGTTAESYGFLVTEDGVGTATFNVGDAGEAFNVADNSAVTTLDLLLATNGNSLNGVLYDLDGDGDADDDLETLFRTLANNVYAAINEQGDI